LVLINLPIDITEGELREVYSRCGSIETIEIFNLRPDLDPGKPSLKELLNRRQKNRRMLKREETSTPVYAKILFRDEEGYRVATNDNLVIFGVVIRKHPCRTTVKHAMRSLFLENLAPGQFSMDIEYQVSKALHPDIYVCLNVGYHDFTGIATCEIKFPSYEVACYAYDRLQGMEDLGAQIQWLPTPFDALLHWTREISFESLLHVFPSFLSYSILLRLGLYLNIFFIKKLITRTQLNLLKMSFNCFRNTTQ